MKTVDIKLKDSDSTPERLLKATQALIATYGYDATTTRMIANLAHVTLSNINFHFGSKEKLVEAAVRRAAEDLQTAYSKLACQVRRSLRHGPLTQEQAWEYIDLVLRDRIHRTMDYESSWIIIGMAEHEGDLPDSSRGILSEVVVRTGERMLAELILAVSDDKDAFRAAIISRSVNATVMAFMEKPLLWQYLAASLGIDLADTQRMEEELHTYFMRSIRAAVSAPVPGISHIPSEVPDLLEIQYNK